MMIFTDYGYLSLTKNIMKILCSILQKVYLEYFQKRLTNLSIDHGLQIAVTKGMGKYRITRIKNI